jgi:hypothetical protein
MNKILLLILCLLNFVSIAQQSLTKRETDEIRYNARRKVEKDLPELLNTLNLSDIGDFERKTLILNSYLPSQNQVFYSDGVVIEDDLRPNISFKDPPIDVSVDKYLSNIGLFYTKSDAATIKVENVVVSPVKQNKDQVTVQVYFTSIFTGNHKTIKQPYVPQLRIAELKVEKNNSEWSVLISSIRFNKEESLKIEEDKNKKEQLLKESEQKRKQEIADKLEQKRNQEIADQLEQKQKQEIADKLALAKKSEEEKQAQEPPKQQINPINIQQTKPKVLPKIIVALVGIGGGGFAYLSKASYDKKITDLNTLTGQFEKDPTGKIYKLTDFENYTARFNEIQKLKTESESKMMIGLGVAGVAFIAETYLLIKKPQQRRISLNPTANGAQLTFNF